MPRTGSSPPSPAASATDATVDGGGSSAGSDHHGALALRRGDPIGNYVVIDRLGAGGMGVVYAAYDPELDRRVAIKLLLPRSGREDAGVAREARAAARVLHPNVIAIHHVGTHRDHVFVVMENVVGASLGRWLTQAPRTRQEILDMFVQAAHGLAAAHAAGIVHRDFKPDNVLVGDDGRVRVLDFGLARGLPEPTSDDPAASGQRPRALLQTAIVGTPAYMAPEQHRGVPCDARADQFSFCVALWEALTGERPFAGDSVAEITVHVLEGRVRPPPSQARLSGPLRAAIERGLAIDPDARHRDMDALVAALRSHAVRRRRGLWLGAAIVLGGAAVGVWASGPDDEHAADPCGVEHSPLSMLWDDTTRARLRDAAAADGSTWNEQATGDAIAQLDRHQAEWNAAWIAQCRARPTDDAERAQQARTASCIDDRRHEFAAAVELLGQGSAEARLQAPAIVAAIREVAVCQDQEVLSRRVPPPPADVMVEVQAVRADMQRVRAAIRIGTFGRARSLVDELAPRVAAAGWEQLDFEFDVLATDAAYGGDQRAYTRHLRELFDVGLRLGDASTTARIAADLAWQVGHTEHDVEAGLAWIATARALAKRAGDESNLDSQLLNVEGVVRSVTGEQERAQEIFETLVERARAGKDAAALFATSLNLANVYAERGELERAVEIYDRVVVDARAEFGALHPQLARPEFGLGRVYRGLSDPVRAREHLEAALAVLTAGTTVDHLLRSSVLAELAECAAGDDAAAAVAWAHEAVAEAELAGVVAAQIRAQATLIEVLRKTGTSSPAELDRLSLALTRRADQLLPEERLLALLRRVEVLQDASRLEEAAGSVASIRELCGVQVIAPRDRVHALAVVARVAAARHDTEMLRGLLATADAIPVEMLLNVAVLGQERLELAGLRWDLGEDRAPARAAIVALRDAIDAGAPAPASLRAATTAWLDAHPLP